MAGDIAIIPCTFKFRNADGTYTVLSEWSEVKDESNGTKYGYDISKLTDSSIETWAFKNCTSLVFCELPGTIVSIKGQAFEGCSQLNKQEDSSC